MHFPMLETDRRRRVDGREASTNPEDSRFRKHDAAQTGVGGRMVWLGRREPVGSFWLGQALVAAPRP
jgi:hypothetical protein